MQPVNQNQQGTPDAVVGLNVLVFVLRIWATSVEVFLHRDMGSRYLGFNALGVYVLVPVYWSLLWPQHNPTPMSWFLIAYFGMMLVTRFSALKRGYRREVCHSYYNGYPRLLDSAKSAVKDELHFKQHVEPMSLIVFGFGVMILNAPSGWYLVLAGVAILILGGISTLANQTRQMDMVDAMIEQQNLAEQFRNRW